MGSLISLGLRKPLITQQCSTSCRAPVPVGPLLQPSQDMLCQLVPTGAGQGCPPGLGGGAGCPLGLGLCTRGRRLTGAGSSGVTWTLEVEGTGNQRWKPMWGLRSCHLPTPDFCMVRRLDFRSSCQDHCHSNTRSPAPRPSILRTSLHHRGCFPRLGLPGQRLQSQTQSLG